MKRKSEAGGPEGKTQSPGKKLCKSSEPGR